MQVCKPSKATENKTGFVACSPRLVSHTHYTNQMKQERGREKWPEKSFNSSAPTKGCLCGMETVSGCSWLPFTFQTVMMLTAGLKLHLHGLTKQIVFITFLS